MPVKASFIFSSWRFTLPSYTTLPIRVTTPPIREASTRAVRATVRPVRSAIASLDRLHRVGRQRHRAGDLGLHDVEKVHQAALVLGLEIGQEHQAVAVGQEHEELADDRAGREAREQLLHERRLPLHRDGRVHQDPLEVGVAPHERDKRLELTAAGLRVALFPADVEQRPRVPGG